MQPQKTPAIVKTNRRGSLPKSVLLCPGFTRGHLRAVKNTRVPSAAAAREAALLLNPATFAAEMPAR